MQTLERCGKVVIKFQSYTVPLILNMDSSVSPRLIQMKTALLLPFSVLYA